MNTCEDCGCKLRNGKCPNCHEEAIILDQYYELEMPLPSEDSEFMKKAQDQLKQISKQ